MAHTLSAVLLLLAGVVTARFLGPEGRGFYAVFFTTAGLMSQLFYFGLTQANVYYMNREKKSYDEIVGNSVLFLLGQAVLLAFLIFVFQTTVKEFFPSAGHMQVMAMLWAAAILQTCCDLYLGILMGRKLFFLYALNSITTAAGVLMTAFAALWYPEHVERVIFIRVAVFAMIVGVFLFIIRNKTKPKPRISFPLLSLQLKFGLKNYIQNLVGTLNYRLYLLLISFMLGNSAAGLFSVAMLFAETLRLLPNAVGPVLLSYLSSEHDDKAHTDLTAKVCRQVLAIILVGLVFYIPITPYLLHYVFGAEYSGALNTVWLMIFGGFLGVMFQMLTRYFTSLHLQHYSIKASVAALIVAVILSLLLIPEYGIVGGAVAYASGNLVATCIVTYFYCRYTGVALRKLLILQRSDISDCVGFIASILKVK